MAVGFGWFKCLELEDAGLRTAETWNPAFRKDELAVWLQRVERIMHTAKRGISAIREAAWHSEPMRETAG